MRRLRIFSFLAIGVALLHGAQAQKADSAVGPGMPYAAIFVAPSGSDSWSGALETPNSERTDGPVRTLKVAQARERLRLAAMSAGSEARRSVHVVIAPGAYELSEPLAFNESDSGTAGFPVVYEAATPGTVSVSGGSTLTKLSTQASVTTFSAANLQGDMWTGATQLFVNGQRAVLARQPNDGSFWFVQKRFVLPSGKAGQTDLQAFGADSEALNWMAGLSAADRARAVVDIYHSWTAGRYRLAENAPPKAIAIRPSASSAFLQNGKSQRYFIENVAKALDAPGEWFGDATGVRYIARPNESAASLAAVVPVLDRLVTIKGSLAGARWAQYLELRGLNFEHSRYLTSSAGFVDVQAAVDVGAAIEIDAARNIVVDRCRVAHTGGYGLWLRSSVRDSIVSSSAFEDLGAGGVRVGVTSQAPNDPNGTGGNQIIDNTIDDTGKIFAGAVGVWLGQTWDNTVAHNLIGNTSYTGISVGWQWGYGGTTSGRNHIVGNLLFNIGRGNLSDLSGIYTLGISPGTIIEGNVIREVRGYPGYGPSGPGAWGIYNDEGTSNVVVTNNVVIGTDSGGYHLHYGRDDVIRHNLFAMGASAEVRVTHSDPANTQLAFNGNLLIPMASQPFDAAASPPDVNFAGNMVSSAAIVGNGTLDLRKCGVGCAAVRTTVRVGADPKQISLENAPADAADGFGRVVRDSGPRAASPARRFAVALAAPNVVLAPLRPAEFDIDGTPPGAQTDGLTYSPAGDLKAVSVVEQPGAPQGKCLRFNDSASFKHRFEPYAYAAFNHESGISSVEFKIWTDPNTVLIHEWRDGSTPYQVGPSLTISAAGVSVNGRVVAPVVPQSWATIRIRSTLGVVPSRWSLEMIDALGRSTSLPNLSPNSPGWKQLNWLGFISNADVNSSFCLADLKVLNTPR